jgi:hypothetical protein
MSSANCRAPLGVSGIALRGCARFGVASGALRTAGPRLGMGAGPLLRPIVVRRAAPSPAFACEARSFGRAGFLLAAATVGLTARFGAGASDRAELVRFVVVRVVVVRFAGAEGFPAASGRFFVTKILPRCPDKRGETLRGC